ncbi:MAG: hypothetical protein HN353_06630 [Bdellovibrionales bacterium]|jgi:flagellar motor switch protein FliG|nr:hypothetical protein [Bdellovibrionales bacterium]MBT3526438.1 hypothetical protein [Bdellovibrionales bacterium]MBT7669561.1 hypothetical protein [Bdellovibrionales bacterium]MBT7765708.1 hypothetical protein [Bdellovibrionales bacterium]
MIKLGGVEEAAKMLAGLGPKERERLLELIAKQDPNMAETLRQQMVTMEDLRFLTVKMIQDLLTKIDINQLGKALRLASDELRSHILSNVSQGIREDIEVVLLGPPIQVSDAEAATDAIMEVVLKMVESGELVLNQAGSEEYV